VIAMANDTEFIKGGDLSYQLRVEEYGGIFREGGVKQDALTIFKRHGFNYARARLFHTPNGSHGSREGLDYVLALAKRFKAAELSFLLDIHYSDVWADPGKQGVPRAWRDLSIDELAGAVREYTFSVISAFKRQGTPPAMVQIGNEITGGMMWPLGDTRGKGEQAWARLARLIRAGQRGVLDALGPDQRVVLMHHIDRADKARWHLDHLLKHGVKFDVLGLSYYPWWHGTMSRLRRDLHLIVKRYGLDIIIVETAYPWTTKTFDDWGNIYDSKYHKVEAPYAHTPAGQKRFIEELFKIVRGLPNNRGKGIFWWEPSWISIKQPHDYRPGEMVNHNGKGDVMPAFGSCVENICLFDDRGEALPAMRVFDE